MSKKTKTAKAPKKGAQLKIANTGRIDANEAIEEQAEKVKTLCAQRMDLENEERKSRELLTELLKKAGVTEYKFEDTAGEPYRAFIPKSKESNAKVQKMKTKARED